MSYRVLIVLNRIFYSIHRVRASGTLTSARIGYFVPIHAHLTYTPHYIFLTTTIITVIYCGLVWSVIDYNAGYSTSQRHRTGYQNKRKNANVKDRKRWIVPETQLFVGYTCRSK